MLMMTAEIPTRINDETAAWQTNSSRQYDRVLSKEWSRTDLAVNKAELTQITENRIQNWTKTSLRLLAIITGAFV